VDIKRIAPNIQAGDNVEMIWPESKESSTFHIVPCGYGATQEWLGTIPENMRGKMVIAGSVSPQIKNTLTSAFTQASWVATEDTAEYFAHAKNNSINALYIVTDERNYPQKMVNMWEPKLKRGGYIAGHDYNPVLFSGCVVAINEALGKPDKVYPDTSWLIRKQ
jgi:hypothetical protein